MWAAAWKPPALLNPWEWAESTLELPARVSPIRGPFSTSGTPYVREPLEAFADPAIRRIILCWSAQSSKTTTAMIAVLYTVEHDPGNVLVVRPSLKSAQVFSEGRLLPMILENATLARHRTGDRHDLKKTDITLDRMTIFLRGANPNQLSAESVKVLVLDETDKYEDYRADKAEADMVSLALERLKFQKNNKALLVSTPTVPAGVIWTHYQTGDRRVFHVPCPKCGAFFALRWPLVKWPDSQDLEEVRRGTAVECPHCKGRIGEQHKPALLLAGRWVPENPGAPAEIRSYHLNELYSPATRWGDLVLKFREANAQARVGFLGPLHNFVNSSLAEPWDPTERRSRKDTEILSLRDGRKRGELPGEGKVFGITAAVDCQDLGFWYSVRAWGPDLESWGLAEGFAERLEDVDRILCGVWVGPGGREYVCNAILIDSGGHRTAEVYDWCRRHKRYRPSKGEQRMGRPWSVSPIDKDPKGNPIPGGLRLVRVNTTYYKDLLAGKLALPADGPGAFHVHSEVGPDYLQHMTAEYRDDHGIWVCSGGKRNDLWDTEVLSLCAADMIGLRTWTAPRSGPKPAEASKPTPPPELAPVSSKEPANPYTGGGPGRGGGNPYLGEW